MNTLSPTLTTAIGFLTKYGTRTQYGMFQLSAALFTWLNFSDPMSVQYAAYSVSLWINTTGPPIVLRYDLTDTAGVLENKVLCMFHGLADYARH